jgi:hypothetical protein
MLTDSRMTLIATKPPPIAFPERVIATWNAFAVRSNPLVAIAVAAAALTVPAMIFHRNASEEGLGVSIAGFAIVGPAGIAGHIITRLPTALSVLFACLLIYWLLRRMSASVPAALFGVALLLACPLVIRAEASVSAELPLAMLLFLAFCLWWDGQEKGSMSATRWLATAAVLLLAFSLQGPQAASSTFVSAGAPGAVMRILGDAFPAVLGAMAYLLARGYGGDDAPGVRLDRPGFMAAVACYAAASAVFVLLWPGGIGHYYAPAVLALCVVGGLAYDLLDTRLPLIAAPLLLLTAALLGYALLHAFGWTA